jgi:hypothetical protein
MKPVVVMLLGRAGSGKTSAGKYIQDKYGATVVRFAEPLKNLARELWGFSHEQVWGSFEIKEQVDPRVGISPREALQRLGEGCRKYVNAGVWIEACFNQIRKKIAEGVELFVIDDTRYVNECCTRFMDMDIHVVKLICSDNISKVNSLHPSEAEVDQVPMSYISYVVNSSRKAGLPDVYAKVDDFMSNVIHITPKGNSVV